VRYGVSRVDFGPKDPTKKDSWWRGHYVIKVILCEYHFHFLHGSFPGDSPPPKGTYPRVIGPFEETRESSCPACALDSKIKAGYFIPEALEPEEYWPAFITRVAELAQGINREFGEPM
jgi:hypothetical protein